MIRFSFPKASFTGVFLALSLSAALHAQQLKPGFDKDEYLEMLRVSARQVNVVKADSLPVPLQYKMTYRSPTVGLDNRWDLWEDGAGHAVISIRGTTSTNTSWIENFYGAMVPATGSISIKKDETFNYKLAENPQASVHVGWLTGLAALSPTITEQIKKLHAKGVLQIIILGHSQGGAIAYLLRSYIFYETRAGRLPADIVYKTYCSAAPKPGNMYYAYDFDYITRNGWAFNVVNALDWVPETPFSIQTVTDYNAGNPFAREMVLAGLKKQPFFQRIFLKAAYNQLNNRTRRAQKVMEKYLGRIMYKVVKKTLPDFKEPAYVHGNNYQRAAAPVVLMPDSTYYKTFPQIKGRVFDNHQPGAYYWLAQHWKP